MRKHFLILMLLTLLPFTAWADIVVTPGVYSKTYGDADPDVVVQSMFSYTGDLGVSTKAELAAVLTFARIQNGETAGYTYDYTLVPTGAQVNGQDVIVSGNGKLNIIAKDIATVADPAIPEQTFHVDNWNAPEFELAGLTLGTDYTIEGYTNSADGEITDKGNGNKVTVKGIGNYKGTATYNFDIAALSVGTGTDPIASIAGVFAEYDYTYDGTAKEIPAYTIQENGVDITEFFDFAEPDELTNAGDKEITATAKVASNYTGSFKFKFNIKGKSIEGLTFGAVDDETYTGTAFTPTPTVTDDEYVLTGGDAPTYTYDDEAESGAALNAGTAKVTVEGHGNYTGTKVIEFTIAKRDLADINITAIPAAAYTGDAQTPAVTAAATAGITTLPVVYNAELETGDFTVAYANNTIASTDAQKATATITAVENSNYTGSKSVEFTINKVELTVTPKNFTKIIGDDDPTNEDLVSNEYYTITGFVNDETVLTAGVTGAPVFAIADHDETVGDKDGVITISSVAGLSAQNYSFAAGAAAKLIIAPTPAVTIAFKDNIQVTYGDVDALTAITTAANAKNYINVEGLVEEDNYVTSMTIAFVDAEGNAVEPKNVGTYYLKATPATITINENQGNYNFADVEIANGSFEIVARPIAFKAVNQTLTYGEAPITTTGADRIELVSGSYAYTDGRSDMNLTLTVDPSYTGAVGEHTGVLKLDADNDNYDITLTDGNILVVAGAGALDLATIDAADVYDKIQDYDNVPCNVVIPFGDRTRAYKTGGTEYGWAAEKWNTLVLPFDITVAELSKKLGYAIVNVIDEKRTVVDGENSKVYGKLTMKGGNGSDEVLVANKPFMLKTTEPITGNVTFEGVTIKAPQSIEDCTVDAGKGVKFIGTYAEKEVSATDNGKIWFMEGDETEWATIFEGSTSTWTLVPFEGYVDLNGAAGARNIIFIMEELDGSATAIKSINADKLNGKIAEGMYNMNGMKMNSVPTQKGVYIVNGKKVVIK